MDPAGSPQGDITRLLASWSRGDPTASAELFARLYDQLRRVAHRAMADQRSERILQTTALVHEAYLRLAAGPAPDLDGRHRFVALAARAMRCVLVDRARERLAAKRGAGRAPAVLDDERTVAGDHAMEALVVDEVVEALTRHAPRVAETFELRFYGGCTVDEVAALTGRSPRTVKREWRTARALLADGLDGVHDDG